MDLNDQQYVSRGGIKLAAALRAFGLDCADRVAADLGSHLGGFVDCLLQRQVRRVHAVDTGYGTLAWKLRRDPRVVVHERCNALHIRLPEPVDLVTVDVGWTRQRLILPAARTLLTAGGCIVTLIKPHYEADPRRLVKGVLPVEHLAEVVDTVLREAVQTGLSIVARCDSPISGHGGNREVFALLSP